MLLLYEQIQAELRGVQRDEFAKNHEINNLINITQGYGSYGYTFVNL